MSDNVQENDMEGILSSIKDILEEDERQQQSNEVADSFDADNILDEVLGSSEVDDVLELSPDMRVDETIEESVDEDVLLDVNELLTDVNTQADEGVINEEPVAEVADDTPVADVETFYESPVSDEDIALLNEPFFETEIPEESTPINEPFFETYDNAEVETLLEDNHSDEQIPDVFETGNDATDLSIDELLGGDVAEPVAVEEDLAPVYEEPAVVEETAVYDPVIEIEPVVEDVVEEEKQDVSSNIMSNFAKMFSHEENTEEAQITSVGNTSKTLEDLVVDAIQKAIGKEISAKWNNGADFNSFVEAEIRRQVETWIANNMSNVIENIVKKEVERVIAKVSS